MAYNEIAQLQHRLKRLEKTYNKNYADNNKLIFIVEFIKDGEEPVIIRTPVNRRTYHSATIPNIRIYFHRQTTNNIKEL